MKIDARQVGRVLQEAGSWRAILLYGEDQGLIRERALAAIAQLVPTPDDPFRVARLEGETHVRLEEESLALSLSGGRRVVWVRDAQDGLVAVLERVLAASSDTLIVMEAPGLVARSKLRSLAESRKDVAAIGCYPEEGRTLSHTVTDRLGREGVSIDRDALAWLIAHLGADRGSVRGEIEKLALYAGQGGRLTLDDVRDCVGDSGSSSVEEAVYAALCGDRATADQALERALADGVNPVAVARTILSVLDRLLRVALPIAEGRSPTEAMAALRPPIFFKYKEAFLRVLKRWNPASLARAASETQAFELACKQSGTPDTVLCRRHLASLCQIRKH